MSNDSIVNKFVNNFPIELHLFDPVVGKYSACGPGTKHKERTRSISKQVIPHTSTRMNSISIVFIMTVHMTSTKTSPIGRLPIKS